MDITTNSSVIENELHSHVEYDGGDGSNENVIRLNIDEEVKIIEDNDYSTYVVAATIISSS